MSDATRSGPLHPGERTGAHESSSETTRREFLVLSGGAIAVAVAPLGSAEADPHVARSHGPGPVEIVLHVNGGRRHVNVRPGATLVSVLREQLGLTGTKVGCDRGACGACTVLLDGVPVSACMTLAVEVGAREVTTIEGLATARGLNPVQQAFVDHDAIQCGFCTPGMVLACVALLGRSPSPTLDEVKRATAGNLCRCGTYPKVFEAVLSLAGRGFRRGS